MLAYRLDNLVLVEKIDFSLSWMDIDVNPLGIDFQAEVYKGMTILGKECGIGLLDGFADVGRLHASMVDEKQKGCLLDAVVRVGRPALRLETPTVISCRKLYQLGRDTTTIDLAYPIHHGSIALDGYARRGLSVLLA
jgi:hypothetical protein